MIKLKSALAFTLALVVGLFTGLAVPAMSQPTTNYTNLTSDYVTDLNISPAYDTTEYESAYSTLSKVGQPEGIDAQHIRFMGYSDHAFTTDMMFTVLDPDIESNLVFISLPDSTPVLMLTDLPGDEAELIEYNIIECQEDTGQIDPCIRGNALFF